MNYPDYKIKAVDWRGGADDYGAIAIDPDDPRTNDPLVRLDIAGIASESYYARVDGDNHPYNTPLAGAPAHVWCRALVAAKLERVNALLAPHGAELFVFDAYRPIETQRALWDFYFARAAAEQPRASARDIRAAVRRYVSDPSRFSSRDPSTWPSHTTGGAVDVSLRSIQTRDLLDMGAGFDDMRAISHSDALERARAAGAIGPDDAALANRRLLHWAMESEGFVNYPLEFWHFDWGDQMYVHNLIQRGANGPRAAWYGYIDRPADA